MYATNFSRSTLFVEQRILVVRGLRCNPLATPSSADLLSAVCYIRPSLFSVTMACLPSDETSLYNQDGPLCQSQIRSSFYSRT